MNPLSLLKLIDVKVWLFCAIILLAGIAVWQYGNYRERQGERRVQGRFDTFKQEVKTATDRAIERRRVENEIATEVHKKQLSAQKEGFKDEVSKIQGRYNADLADATRRLRIPAAPGDCAGSAGEAKAESGQGSNDAPPGTVALPEETERDLRSLMAEADRIVASCRVGQQFIKDNGFEEK